MIGLIKYMGKFGINSHESAAFTIGRRGIGLSDKIPSEFTRGPLDKMVHRHEWSKWNVINKGIKNKRITRHLFYQWRSLQDSAGKFSKNYEVNLGVIFDKFLLKACNS